MSDFIETLPNGILKNLLNLVAKFYDTCTWIFDNFTRSLSSIILEYVEASDTPEWLVTILKGLLTSNAAWIYKFSVLDLILGTMLIFVLVYGVVKFFTDIVL